MSNDDILSALSARAEGRGRVDSVREVDEYGIEIELISATRFDWDS